LINHQHYQLTTKPYNTIVAEAKHHCIKNFGFVSDPSKKLWENIPSALKALPSKFVLQSPVNQHCHNLCTETAPPPGYNYLLGLGLNYCIETLHPKPNINLTVKKLEKSIRLKHWLSKNGIENNEDYIPSLYVPTTWKPPEASHEIEEAIQTFTTNLNRMVKNNKTHPRANLTKLQHCCLHSIKNNNKLIVCLSDKNLGPVIMERETYLKKCLTEHLLCPRTYVRLTEEEALQKLRDTRCKLNQIRLNYRKNLTDAENTYFQRAAKLEYRIPQFYLTIKIHKTPIKTRPIVSCVNSYLNVFSKWLAHRFNDLLPNVPTYVKDSFQVLDELKALHLPSHAKLFTCDAVSMYTNIDSLHGIEVISLWLEEYSLEIPPDFPTLLFQKILQTVMTHNVFQLDNTFWLQTSGTSMGTSCACAYATLYWGYIERKHILPKWQHHLLYLRRFIDDKLGIWIGPEEDFQTFIDDLNSYSQLQWETEGLKTSITFLDLTIDVNANGTIKTKTFQKPTNLHLYIPPNSAHPPGVLKSIIYGNLRRYWLQNTDVTDYINIAQQFASRLCARGYDRNKIMELFIQAAQHIDNTASKKLPRDNSSTIYLHWTWHPRDISKSKLRLLFNKTLKEKCGFKHLIIAYSRPKNLRDCLMKTQLSEPEGNRVSSLLPPS